MVFGKRRRKNIAPLVLALWLFAIFVSVAHACGLDEELTYGAPSEAVNVVGHDRSDHDTSPACAKFCSDDFPLLAKLKAVQDPPAGQALLTPTFVSESFQTAPARVPMLLPWPRPSPSIAVNIRFVRLAL